jgi:poly(3-hydroxybutyrate) depolymerase
MAKLETYSFFDASKVYGIGVSNGSALINKLGIETAHFSAIAALASQLIIGTIPNNSTSPVAVYQMCGTLDNIIPYGGGMSVVGHHFLSASDSALSWVNAFNCTTEPIVEMLGDDEILIYEDCESGKEIRFHSVNNAGHNLNQPNTTNFYGPVWEFLKRF